MMTAEPCSVPNHADANQNALTNGAAGIDDTSERTARIAAHEFTRLLRHVSLSADQLLADGLHTPDARQMVELIASSAQRARRLVAGLRDYLTVPTTLEARESVTLSKLVAHAADDLAKEINATGASVLCEGDATLRVDPDLMSLALSALIENALVFRGAAAPVVRISATAAEDPQTHADVWRVLISDNGVGVKNAATRNAVRAV